MRANLNGIKLKKPDKLIGSIMPNTINIVVNKPVNNKENYNGTQFSDNLLMVRRVYA